MAVFFIGNFAKRKKGLFVHLGDSIYLRTKRIASQITGPTYSQKGKQGGKKMNGYIPYGANSFQGTQYFPQPQGNVYLINNSLEVANVPMGSGLSMAICPSEGTMYLKTLQGGAPSLIVYSIAPYEAPVSQNEVPDLATQIAELRAEIEALKKPKGGAFSELI